MDSGRRRSRRSSLPRSTQAKPLSTRTLFLAAILAASSSCVLGYYDLYPDLRGDYCRTRKPEQCCSGRFDECSVPILGTLCYCDHFCNRSDSSDCCPDFRDVCLGISDPPPIPAPIKRCFYKDEYLFEGIVLTDNCNQCKCRNGDVVCEAEPCMIDPDAVDEINSMNSRNGWKASNYSDFWGRKLEDGLVYKTGTLLPSAAAMKMYPIRLMYEEALLPREFDARKKWPGLISIPRDQGWCGSSWAFSTLAVTRDRLAIETKGKENVALSPQNLISCDKHGQKGCQGGHVERAWNYLRKYGVVDEECYQYTSGLTGKVDVCHIPKNSAAFNLPCDNGRSVPFHRKDMYRTEPAYRIASASSDIKWEIMNNGPVQAVMTVYPDLFMYRSGVYASTQVGNGAKASRHSVRLLGWGQDPLHGPYWLAANSWGDQWGEGGFFRIRRGFNDSGVEEFILAVRTRLSAGQIGANGLNRRFNRSRRWRRRRWHALRHSHTA